MAEVSLLSATFSEQLLIRATFSLTGFCSELPPSLSLSHLLCSFCNPVLLFAQPAHCVFATSSYMAREWHIAREWYIELPMLKGYFLRSCCNSQLPAAIRHRRSSITDAFLHSSSAPSNRHHFGSEIPGAQIQGRSAALRF